MKNLLDGSSNYSFSDYAERFLCTPLSLCEGTLPEFSQDILRMVQRFWKASELEPRHDNERQLQPVIHLMLDCAAQAAQNASPDKLYYVCSEPAIMKGREDRLSDEALVEVISEGDRMRVLLEVKGTNVFPTNFHQSGEKAFSQLIQQVALSLESKLWKEDIMCGVVIRNTWYLFKIKEKTVGDKIVLDVVESAFSRLQEPSKNMDSVQRCLHYLVQYQSCEC